MKYSPAESRKKRWRFQSMNAGNRDLELGQVCPLDLCGNLKLSKNLNFLIKKPFGLYFA
jgi:hypothetical protein